MSFLDEQKLDQEKYLSWLLIMPHLEEILENWMRFCSQKNLLYVTYKFVDFNTFLLKPDRDWIVKADNVLTRFGSLDKSAVAYFDAAIYFSKGESFDIADELFLRSFIRFLRAIHTPWRSYTFIGYSIYLIPSFFAKSANFISLQTTGDYVVAMISLPFLILYIALFVNILKIREQTRVLEVKLKDQTISQIDQLNWSTLLTSSLLLKFNLYYIPGFLHFNLSLWGKFLKPFMIYLIKHSLKQGQLARANSISDEILHIFSTLLNSEDLQVAKLYYEIGENYLAIFIGDDSIQGVDSNLLQGSKEVLEKSEILLKQSLHIFQNFYDTEKIEQIKQSLEVIEHEKNYGVHMKQSHQKLDNSGKSEGIEKPRKSKKGFG